MSPLGAPIDKTYWDGDDVMSSETMLPSSGVDMRDMLRDLPAAVSALEKLNRQETSSSSSSSSFSSDAEGQFKGEAQSRTVQYSPAMCSTQSPTSPHISERLSLLPGEQAFLVEGEPTQALHHLQTILERSWPTQTTMREGILTATVFIEFVAVEVEVRVVQIDVESCAFVFKQMGQNKVVFFSRLCKCAEACWLGLPGVHEEEFFDDSMDFFEPGANFIQHWWTELLSTMSLAVRLELLQVIATWTERSEESSSAVAQIVSEDELSRLLTSAKSSLAEIYLLAVILRNAARSPLAKMMPHVVPAVKNALSMMPPSIASQELQLVVELLSKS